jgi:hypothetical protein
MDEYPNPYNNPNKELIHKINAISEQTGESIETVTKILRASYEHYMQSICAALDIK